jgi:hypothetical protein
LREGYGKKFLAIKFKRTRDARSKYVERATTVAQEQYTSLLTGLQAVCQVKGWKVQQIVFVRSKWDPIRKKLVRHLLEEQDKVLLSYFAQKGGREVREGKGFMARVGNMSRGPCMREEGANNADPS